MECNFVICILGSAYISEYQAIQSFYVKLLEKVYNKSYIQPNLDSICGFLSHSLQTGPNQDKNSIKYLGIAIRMSQMFQLQFRNKYSDPRLNIFKKRIWWSINMMDITYFNNFGIKMINELNSL